MDSAEVSRPFAPQSPGSLYKTKGATLISQTFSPIQSVSFYKMDQLCTFAKIIHLLSKTNSSPRFLAPPIPIPNNDLIDADNLQLFHYIAIITGIVIFVLSFFDFAGVLYDITLLFVAAVLGIFASGAMMLYATYVAFHMSCKGAFGGISDTISGARNVIQAQDEVGIAIMVLDLIAALLLISAAISFSRTY